MRGGFNRRIIAPIAFIPVALTVRQGPTPTIELSCRGDGVDLIIANTALLAWLEQQTSKPGTEVFADDQGADPWREISELVQRVCQLIEISAPPLSLDNLQLLAAPKSDEADAKPSILPSAVLGLFPMANQGLLRDTQAMVEGESVKGPIESFLKVDVSLDLPPAPHPESAPVATGKISARKAKDQRLVTRADPCQRRAVNLARNSSGLVVHGPLIATLLADLWRRYRPEAMLRTFSFRALRPLYDTASFVTCGLPDAADRSARLWTRDHEGAITMDALARWD